MVGVSHLLKEYAVYYHDTRKGNVILEQEGMYYRIYCECDIRINKPLCLWYIDNNKTIRLGLCDYRRKHLIARMRCADLRNGMFCLKEKTCENEVYNVYALPEPQFILQNLFHLRMKITDSGKGIIVERSSTN